MERPTPEHITEPPSLLELLRSVESTPPGDLDWARHCTRQQAVILALSLPADACSDLTALRTAAAALLGVQIETLGSMPVPGTAFPTADGWTIHVAAQLDLSTRTRVALHELKHVLDHPKRTTTDAPFTHEQYEQLADYFADLMLGDPQPTQAHDLHLERRNSS